MSAATAEPTTIPLWPESVPDLRTDATAEISSPTHSSNIHHPSFTVHPAPAEKTIGTAMLVCPNGGYMRLSMNKEVTEIAA